MKDGRAQKKIICFYNEEEETILVGDTMVEIVVKLGKPMEDYNKVKRQVNNAIKNKTTMKVFGIRCHVVAVKIK